MIKLIITDMDGTFLNSKGSYDKTLFAEVKNLMDEKGVHFAACTGKQCDRVEELFGDFVKNIWVVGDSATRIRRNGQFIYQSLLENKIGLRIISTLQNLASDHVIIACNSQGAVILKNTPQHIKEKLRHSYATIFEVDDLTKMTSDFVKITVFSEHERCPEISPHLTEYENDAYIVVSDAAWIDIAAYGVHKGSTIKKLQEVLAVNKNETMAFGDGYNDIELLERAEYSFAMINAFEETKSVARFITGYNDDNAVLETIKRILILQH